MAFRNPLKSLLIQGSQLDPTALDGMTMHNVVISTTFPLTCGLLTSSNETITGSPIDGTYHSSYPVHTLDRRQNGTSDANGLVVVSLDSTCIMWMHANLELDGAHILVIRPAETVASAGGRCVWRTHRTSDGVAVGGIGYTIMTRIAYQNGP